MKAFTVKDGLISNVAKFKDGGELPNGWSEAKNGESIGWIDNGGGNFSAPIQPEQDPPTPKEIRDQALAALVHDFGDGRVIQCRPHPFSDESNMRNAIEKMDRLGQSSRVWLSAHDTLFTVSQADLQTAIESGQDQSDVVWADFLGAIPD